MPEDLSAALPHVRRMVEALSIPALTCDGYEADDIIGTLVRRARKGRLHVLHGHVRQGLRPTHHGEHLHL